MSSAEMTSQDALAEMFPTKEEQKARKGATTERFKPRKAPAPRAKAGALHSGTDIPVAPRTPAHLTVADAPPTPDAAPVDAPAAPVIPTAPREAPKATTPPSEDLRSPDVFTRIGALRLQWTDPDTGERVRCSTHERNLSIRVPIHNRVKRLIEEIEQEEGIQLTMTDMTELAYMFLPADPGEAYEAYRALRKQGSRKKPGPEPQRVALDD